MFRARARIEFSTLAPAGRLRACLAAGAERVFCRNCTCAIEKALVLWERKSACSALRPCAPVQALELGACFLLKNDCFRRAAEACVRRESSERLFNAEPGARVLALSSARMLHRGPDAPVQIACEFQNLRSLNPGSIPRSCPPMFGPTHIQPADELAPRLEGQPRKAN